MTEKQTELHRIVLRLAESGELATLTKLMLDIESTIEKYKRLEDAAKEYAEYTQRDSAMRLALKELEQE